MKSMKLVVLVSTDSGLKKRLSPTGLLDSMKFYDNRLSVRFWNKVQPEPNTGCWLWTGALNTGGYGQVMYGGRGVTSHKLVMETLGHDYDSGLVTDHLCRERLCCNPEHLELVTSRENTLRGVSPSARNHNKTHCVRGHEFTLANTYYVPGHKNPSRMCRACPQEMRKRHIANSKRVTEDE